MDNAKATSAICYFVTRPNICPIRGGLEIFPGAHPEQPPGVKYCTVGFTAQGKVDSKRYIIVAGHCVHDHTLPWVAQITSHGDFADVGPVWNWEWDGGGDMAIIAVTGTTIWDPQPWVLVTDSADTTANPTYPITSDNTSVVGMRICTTGFAYGSDCGTVTELGVTATYDDGWINIDDPVHATLPTVTVHHLGRASYCSWFGDSGGPLYASHVAYGIQAAHFSDCDSLYQGIESVETKMNVDVLHPVS